MDFLFDLLSTFSGFRPSWLIEFLIIPPGGSLLLALLGFLVMRRSGGLGTVLVTLGLVSLYLVSIPFGSLMITSTLEGRIAPLGKAPPQAQAIIVLGGGYRTLSPEYGTASVSDSTLARLRYAAHLHRNTNLPVLVSGGSVEGGDQSEAGLMARTLREEFRVPVRWIESSSNNTCENARYSTALLASEGITHALVVTRAMHMPRSIACFDRQRFRVTPAAMGYSYATLPETGVLAFVPQPHSVFRSYQALHEWLGLGWMALGDLKDEYLP